MKLTASSKKGEMRVFVSQTVARHTLINDVNEKQGVKSPQRTPSVFEPIAETAFLTKPRTGLI